MSAQLPTIHAQSIWRRLWAASELDNEGPEADRLRNELDEPWLRMTEAERDAFDVWTCEYEREQSIK